MTQICLKYYLLGSKECTVASPKSTVLGAKKLGQFNRKFRKVLE
jgi:hypothetical protein